MELRLKKIGKVKATSFNKDFDGVYDYWKKRAEKEFNYYDELKFIKEHNQVFIYIKMELIDEGDLIDPENWTED